MSLSKDISDCITDIMAREIDWGSVPRDIGIQEPQWYELVDDVVACIKIKHPELKLEISRSDSAFWFERPIRDFAERLVAAIA